MQDNKKPNDTDTFETIINTISNPGLAKMAGAVSADNNNKNLLEAAAGQQPKHQ